MSQIQGRVFDSSVYGWIADVAVALSEETTGTSYIYVDGSLGERDASIQNLVNISELKLDEASIGPDFFWSDGSLGVSASALITKGYVDASLTERDVSIEWIRSYQSIQDNSIYSLDASIVINRSNINTNSGLISEILADVNDISTYVYAGLKTYIDSSLSERDTSIANLVIDINDLSTNTYSRSYIDSSLLGVLDKAVLESSLGSDFTWVDGSLGVTGVSGYATTSYVDVSLSERDTSIANLLSDINDLSTNTYSRSYIDSSLSERDTSIANLLSDINDLSTNTYSKAYLDSSLNNLGSDIADLSTNTYSRSYIDSSLLGVLNKAVLESSLGSDFTWVDGSLGVTGVSGYATTSYVDGSLNERDTNIANLVIDINDLSTNTYSRSYIDSSLFGVLDKAVLESSLGPIFVYSDSSYGIDSGTLAQASYVDGSLSERDVSIEWLADNTYNKSYIDGSLSERDTSIAYLDDYKMPIDNYVTTLNSGSDYNQWRLNMTATDGSTSRFDFRARGPLDVNTGPWIEIYGPEPYLYLNASYSGVENRTIKPESDSYVDSRYTKTSVLDSSSGKADKNVGIITKSSDYTLEASTAGWTIDCDASITITLPDNMSVGYQVIIHNSSTGYVSLDGSILRSVDGSTMITEQWGMATAIHFGSGNWSIGGNLKDV